MLKRLFVAALLMALGNPAPLMAGWQKDEVCQGSCGGGCGPCPDSDSSSSASTPAPNIAWGGMTKRATGMVKDCNGAPGCVLFRSVVLVPIGVVIDLPVFAIKGVGYGLYYGGKGIVYAGKGVGHAIAYPFNRPAAVRPPASTWEQYKRDVLAYQKAVTKHRPANKENEKWCKGHIPLSMGPNRANWEARCNPNGSVEHTAAMAMPAQAVAGIDFTGSLPAPSADPKVVDARHLPSGLPKSIESAIATTYPNASPAVTGRVEKGYQAMLAHDWPVARAWFEDAFYRDPGNPALRRMIDLCAYTEEFNRKTAADKAAARAADAAEAEKQRFAQKASQPITFEQWSDNLSKIMLDQMLNPPPPPAPIAAKDIPSRAEVDEFFARFQDGRPYRPKEKVRLYVTSLSKEDFKAHLALQLPTNEDLELLFPMEAPPAGQPKK